jgi:hypothetical protein
MRQDHGANSLLLFATVALALGLATVTAGIAPFGDEPRDLLPHRPRGLDARAVAVVVTNRVAGDGPTLPLTSGRGLPRASRPVALGAGGTSHLSTSPLFSQHERARWERLFVRARHDPRALLLATAIQVHAPAVAAPRIPDIVLPSKEG